METNYEPKDPDTNQIRDYIKQRKLTPFSKNRKDPESEMGVSQSEQVSRTEADCHQMELREANSQEIRGSFHEMGIGSSYEKYETQKEKENENPSNSNRVLEKSQSQQKLKEKKENLEEGIKPSSQMVKTPEKQRGRVSETPKGKLSRSLQKEDVQARSIKKIISPNWNGNGNYCVFQMDENYRKTYGNKIGFSPLRKIPLSENGKAVEDVRSIGKLDADPIYFPLSATKNLEKFY